MLPPRTATFSNQMLTYGTNPDQVVLAKAVEEALMAWAAEAAQRPDKWDADAVMAVTIARLTVKNLLRATNEEGTLGQVAFFQALAYAWDAGLAVQKVKGLLRPVFPNAASWMKLGDDILAGLEALATEAGFPVKRTVVLIDTAYSSMLKVSREDSNRALLRAHFSALDLDNYHCLNGETVFCTDGGLISAAQCRSKQLSGIVSQEVHSVPALFM